MNKVWKIIARLRGYYQVHDVYEDERLCVWSDKHNIHFHGPNAWKDAALK